MVLITNFGDVTTTGNMIVSNSLTVLGAFTSFTSLLTGGSAPLSIANVTNPFSQVFASTLTSTTANVTSIYGTQGFVGVGTASPQGTTLYVQGNVFVSNAIQTTNIYATTANVTTVNALFIVNSTGALGIGTGNPQGANLYVQGNVFASNALSAPNIYATTINASTINTGSLIISSNLGIGAIPGLANLYVQGNVIVTNALTTTNIFAGNLVASGNIYVGGFVNSPNVTSTFANLTSINALYVVASGNVGIGTIAQGANLYVQGNAVISNALTTTNVFASSINVTTVNTVSLFTTSGLLGIGTTSAQGTSLYVQGNIYASNALTVTNIYATLANLAFLNVVTLYVSSNIGIGSNPGQTNLYVQGNVFVSNSLQTTNIFATTLNVTTLNTGSIFGQSGFIGIGTANPQGTTLYVQGNIFASNALTTTNIYSTILNTVTLNTTSLFVSSNVGIGTASAQGANLYVLGNVFVSNSLTTTNIFSTLVTTGTLNATTVVVTSNIGIGTASAQGANLYVQGNVFVSNSITTTNVYANSVNVTTANLTSIYGPLGFVGINTGNAQGFPLYVQGNVFVSSNLSVINIFSTTINASIINVSSLVVSGNIGIGTNNPQGANLYVQGNVFVSNALSTTNLFVTGTLNVSTINTVSLFVSSNIGIGTASAQGANLYVQGNVFVSNALSTTNIFTTGTINTVSINTGSLVVSSNIGIGSSAQGANLYVLGNIFASNALSTTNIFVTGTLNTLTINTFSLSIASNLAIGTASAQGTNLYVQGNVYVSNALSTANIFVTGTLNAATINTVSLVFSSNLGIGTASAQGANLYVQGNVFVSNALSMTNLFATTINVGTINTSTLIFASNAGIGTSNPQGANLYVQGNVYVSNALSTTNLFVTGTLNVNTINTSSFLFTTLGIGAPPGTTALYVQGNVYVSGNLYSPNISAQTIYYGEDLFKRGPYLQPSPANANTIQAWISATSNASSQPTRSWWATSATPVFGNVGNTPTTNFFGSLLLPDGRIFFVPTAGNSVGFFNPTTGLYTSTPATFVSTGLRGAVLTPNGNIVMIPWGTYSNVVVLNPLSLVSSNIITGVAVPNAFQGGVLGPSGNVIMCPVASGNIGLVNPTAMTYINVGPTGAAAFSGAVLLPNGNVFFGGQNGANSAIYNTSCIATVSGSTTLGGNFTNVSTGGSSLQSVFLAPSGNVIGLPYSGGNIVSINPTLFTASNTACGASLMGGAMLPSGNLICTPSASQNVGMFDTVALTYSNVAGAVTSGVAGATLYPDGRVFFAPSLGNVGCMSTMVPVDPAWCLGPYFNKF